MTTSTLSVRGRGRHRSHHYFCLPRHTDAFDCRAASYQRPVIILLVTGIPATRRRLLSMRLSELAAGLVTEACAIAAGGISKPDTTMWRWLTGRDDQRQRYHSDVVPTAFQPSSRYWGCPPFSFKGVSGPARRRDLDGAARNDGTARHAVSRHRRIGASCIQYWRLINSM